MQFRTPSRPSVTINIAPLVDVVFLLVIFFAVSTTFLDTAGLALELPESDSTAGREPQELSVLLLADDRVVFAGETVTLAELRRQLGEAIAAREEKVVVLRADAATRHGEVVRVMDVIRDAGASGLTVAAREPAPAPP